MKKLLSLLSVILVLTLGCSDARKADSAQYLTSIIEKTDALFINEVTRLLKLSAQPEIIAGSWDAIKPLLADTSLPALCWYALPSGEYWTVAKDHVEANLSDRAYFPQLLEGVPVVGSLIIGKTSRKKSTVIAIPVYRDEKIVAILGTSIYQEELSELLTEDLALPAGFGYFAIAPNGLTSLHSEPQLIFDDVLNRDDVPQMHEVIKEMQTNAAGELKYRWEDQSKVGIYRQSILSEWIFAINYTK